ncbi:hypothetical protein ACOMHN_029803 [Nucella lapillus]
MPRQDSYKSTVERFIGLVQANPVLYDANLPDHRDIEVLNDVWVNISEAMGSSSLDVDGWKKKWRNLRDTYVKQVKFDRIAQSNPALSTSKRKPWRFTQVMKFLDEFIEHKSNAFLPPVSFGDDGNESNGPSDRSDAGSGSCSDRSSVVSTESQRAINGVKVESPFSQLPPMTKPYMLPQNFPVKKARYTDSPVNEDYGTEPTVNFGRHDQPRFVPSEDSDGDEAFFESCALRIKKMPAQTRSFLKLQISQLFVNAENPYIPPLPITPLPSH